MDRPRPAFPPLPVVGERLPEVGKTIDLQGFDRLGDSTMQLLATPGLELGVGRLADPLVREAQALADGREEPPTDQLFHALRRRVVVELAGVPEEIEVELASDHGGHGEE